MVRFVLAKLCTSNTKIISPARLHLKWHHSSSREAILDHRGVIRGGLVTTQTNLTFLPPTKSSEDEKNVQ